MQVPAPTTPPALKFPFLDLQAQYASIRSEITEAVNGVLASQRFILGPEVAALEKDVADFVGCAEAIGCASGSDALLLSLMAANVGPCDEVITTPFTFGATLGSIARLGARPKLVDIDPETFNIDPAAIRGAITDKTRAIMPVHLFGLAADMRPILQIAKETGVVVVEDAAQAIGATYDRAQVGSLGNFGCFSFFPSKNLGGAGDGGMITVRDKQLAKKLRMLRAHGSPAKYRYELVGLNSRLDTIQAAILRVKFKYLEEWAEARRRNAARYLELFDRHGLLGLVTLPIVPDGREHVFNQFVVRVPQRDPLMKHLRQAGIPVEIYYPYPLHLEQAFAFLGYKPGDFPISEKASEEVLALPIYPELTYGQQAMVVETVAEFFNTSANQTALLQEHEHVG